MRRSTSPRHVRRRRDEPRASAEIFEVPLAVAWLDWRHDGGGAQRRDWRRGGAAAAARASPRCVLGMVVLVAFQTRRDRALEAERQAMTRHCSHGPRRELSRGPRPPWTFALDEESRRAAAGTMSSGGIRTQITQLDGRWSATASDRRVDELKPCSRRAGNSSAKSRRSRRRTPEGLCRAIFFFFSDRGRIGQSPAKLAEIADANAQHWPKDQADPFFSAEADRLTDFSGLGMIVDGSLLHGLYAVQRFGSTPSPGAKRIGIRAAAGVERRCGAHHERSRANETCVTRRERRAAEARSAVQKRSRRSAAGGIPRIQNIRRCRRRDRPCPRRLNGPRREGCPI